MTVPGFSRAELLSVQRPSRYIGGEVNSVVKEHSEVRLKFALCFADVYEVGMSHYGLLLLYDILNSRDDVACERAFLPWTDMASLIRKKKIHLKTLETRSDVRSFDVVGVSVSTELSATSLVEFLSLCGLAPFSAEREDALPLVLGGGSAFFNPEPLAPFFDAILIGEGEEAVLEIADAVIEAKEKNESKRELLERLSVIEGVYLPSFFEPLYDGGRFRGVKPLKDGYERVRRRWLSDIGRSSLPACPLLPVSDVVHDRLTVEIARGCVVGCRFCQAGFVYRPLREKDSEQLYGEIMRSLDNSGYGEVSLLSLSSGDYTALDGLISALLDRFREERIALSLPSLRVGSYGRVLDVLSSLRKSGLTIAPEVGSEKLRRLINKPIEEEELLETVREASALGWRSVKLYFMVGLPTETDDDLEAIVELLRRVSAEGKRSGRLQRLNVSLSPFVPKAHTPLQWEPFCGVEELRRKREFLFNRLGRRRDIRLSFHDARMAELETVLSRGDRRVAKAVVEAHRRGAVLDSWGDMFDYDAWQAAFEECGLDKDAYLSEFDVDEPLPWDHIDVGVSKEFLVAERELAHKGVFTPVCRDECCSGCGVCGVGESEAYPSDFLAENVSIRPVRRRPPRQSGIVFRYRVLCTKAEDAAFMGHLQMKKILERAFRRAGLPLNFSEGNNPEPKISFGQPVPLDVESTSEMFDVELTEHIDPKEIVERVNPFLPDGMALYRARPVSPKAPSIGEALTGVRYRVDLGPLLGRYSYADVRRRIESFLSKTDVPFRKERKGKVRIVNLREFVEDVRLMEDGRLQLDARVINSLQVRAKFLLASILGIDESEVAELRIVKVRNFLSEEKVRR